MNSKKACGKIKIKLLKFKNATLFEIHYIQCSFINQFIINLNVNYCKIYYFKNK